MKLSKRDPRIQPKSKTVPAAVFLSAGEAPFQVYGLLQEGAESFSRLPKDLRESKMLGPEMPRLGVHTAGGRIRFRTDSPFIVVRVILKEKTYAPHISASGSNGIDIYTKPEGSATIPEYAGTVMPGMDACDVQYEGICDFLPEQKQMREVTVHFPLYAGVERLQIGLAPGAVYKDPRPYTISEPVVFYGSSITQGACASRPGLSHIASLSRMLDCDIKNLGFSGSAYGEQEIAKYIATLHMRAFVMEYDYNARSDQELLDTHYAFYRTIREKNPDLPIIMVTAPVAAPASRKFGGKVMANARVTVMESYVRAYREGDRHLYFVDGEGIIGNRNGKEALVDGVHPNDLGFSVMAEHLYPVLKSVLYQY